MDDGMRRAFLRFATGSDRVPLLGAHALQLKITVLHAHPERFPATVNHLPFLSILTHLHVQAACGSHVLQPGVSVWIHVQEHAAGQACPGNHRVRRLRSGLTAASCCVHRVLLAWFAMKPATRSWNSRIRPAPAPRMRGKLAIAHRPVCVQTRCQGSATTNRTRAQHLLAQQHPCKAISPACVTHTNDPPPSRPAPDPSIPTQPSSTDMGSSSSKLMKRIEKLR